MSKITAEHLTRKAMIYVRQSTPQQVRDNPESQGWQYDLASRAAQLGWSDVIVVDDDLGRSGGGTERPGFERMLAAVCDNEVGVILAVEASRLSRNGREWHTLIEFCGLVGCLLADERTVYDPRLPNDRLLLGLHGSLSELELSNIRARSREGARRKAMRESCSRPPRSVTGGLAGIPSRLILTCGFARPCRLSFASSRNCRASARCISG